MTDRFSTDGLKDLTGRARASCLAAMLHGDVYAINPDVVLALADYLDKACEIIGSTEVVRDPAIDHGGKYDQLMEMYKEAADSVSRAESQMADLDEIRRGEHEAYEELHSEVIQLRTLVQALRFDTDERDRLTSRKVELEDACNDAADAIVSGVDLSEVAERLRVVADRSIRPMRAVLAEVALERDDYKSMLCDLLASHHAYPADHPAMERLWDRVCDLLKNGPTKP